MALLVAAMVVPTSLARHVSPALANAGTGWTMYHYDQAHDGNDQGEAPMEILQGSPILSGAMDEKIQAEPLIFSGAVYAATENNTMYAFNEFSPTLSLVWSRHL